MEVIPFVGLKNSLAQHSVFHTVVLQIVEKVKDLLPEIEKLRLDPELTKLICTAVKNLLSPKQEKEFDERELVVAVINRLFVLTDTELEQVRTQIEFLYNNKQIKRISILKKIRKEFLAWFSRKFL